MASYKIITTPAIEPLSLDEIKTHLNLVVADTSEDTYLTLLRLAARQYMEEHLDRSLINTTWEAYLDTFEPVIALRKGANSVTTVAYYDTSGNEQTLAANTDYYTDVASTKARIVPVDAWPTTQTRPNAVRVRYVAGFGATAADVPAAIRTAMLLQIARAYEQREDSVEKLPKASEMSVKYYVIYS